MRVGPVVLDLACPFEHGRSGDFRMEIFHALRHVHADAMLVSGRQIFDRRAHGFQFAGNTATRMPLLQIELKFDGHEHRRMNGRDHAGQHFKPGIAHLAAHDGKQRLALRFRSLVGDVRLKCPVAFV